MKKILFFSFFFLFSCYCFAANLVVDNNADDGPGTLREAIAAASDGDDISFNLSSGNETITLAWELSINKTLIIDGSNTAGSGVSVTIDGNNSCGIFSITGVGKTITLENMTTTNGNSPGFGGGIYATSGCVVNLDQITISNCTASEGGGGFYFYESSASITKCTISNNTASDPTSGLGGGGFFYGASGLSITILNSTISHNQAQAFGGLYLQENDGSSMIKFSTIANNICSDENVAGGIGSFNILEISNTIIASNLSNGSAFDFFTTGLVFDIGNNIIGVSDGYTWEQNSDWTDQDADGYYENYGTSEIGPLNLSSSLANNGGQTLTLAVRSSSVAISSGSYDATVTTDQRGITRHNPSSTIGAVEFGVDFTWDGSEGSGWNTSDNWNQSMVPSVLDNVIIANSGTAPLITSGINANCNDLTVNSGASLTVQFGGSLLTNGSVSGSVDVELWVQAGEWHLISAPNSTSTANIFLGNYLQYWSEPDQTWYDISNPSTSLEAVKGYSYWTENPINDAIFSGTPNTGDQEIEITNHVSGSSFGFNLVGNPYPSSIDWATLQPSYGTAYLWNPGANDYDEITDSDIAPMQGFLVWSEMESQLFQMNNSNRSHGGSFQKNQTITENSLILYATYKQFADQFTLIFNDQAEEGFTLTDDAWKLLSGYDGVSQLWSVCSDGNLAIDKRPQTESIQLGFTNNIDGIYSIGIKELNGINTLILEDTKTGVFHNLQEGPCEFSWQTSDEETRFVLHFTEVRIEENYQNNPRPLTYSTNHTIYIKGADRGEIIVSDVMGRVLYQGIIKDAEIFKVPMHFENGTYLISLVYRGETNTVKVIVN